MKKWTIDEIIHANKSAGKYFFEKATMEFFDSEIENGPYSGPGGVFFTTSEQFHDRGRSAPRRYTVRSFNPETGDVGTVRHFNEIKTASEAKKIAEELALKGFIS